MRTTTTALLLALVLAGCGGDPEPAPGLPTPSSEADRGSTTAPAPTPTDPISPTGPASPTSSPASPTSSPADPPSRPGPRTTMVLAVSVDGLAPAALATLGSTRAPTFWHLLDEGASTLNARTEVEMTVTLPNHTGMLTGRRVDAAQGGHGWQANVDNGRRVVDADGDPVPSVFDVVHEAGGSSALFTSKEKFAVFDRTWPAIDEYVYEPDNAALAQDAADDLVTAHRAFTFLHLSWPDEAGHASGWGSADYLQAVEDVDAALADLVATLESDRFLRRHLVLVLTADHGGHGLQHSDTTDPANYTVPFVVVGHGVPARADLYDLDPTRADPGTKQPSYDEDGGPVRNGDVANLATSLLGLDPVPGSELGAEAALAVR